MWRLPTLRLSAIQVAVAMAVSSGAQGLEAVALVADVGPDDQDLATVRALAGTGVRVWWADPSGTVQRVVDRMTSTVPERVDGFRSGFACFVGRPNAGKSTLTNALVGSKIAIASSQPQTTRHAVRGIVHRPDAQLVLIDTPGLHRPRTLLGERLNDLVRATWSEVDIVGVCLPANERIGPGDTYVVGEIAALRKRPTLVAVATKSDLVATQRMAEHLLAIAGARGDPRHQLGAHRAGLGHDERPGDVARRHAGWAAARGPPLYPAGEVTDEPEETLVAELIREAALEGVRDELPHSITVTIEEMGLRADRPAGKPLLDIFASMIVERDSQKGIIIGHRGTRLKEIGASARLRSRPCSAHRCSWTYASRCSRNGSATRST